MLYSPWRVGKDIYAISPASLLLWGHFTARQLLAEVRFAWLHSFEKSPPQDTCYHYFPSLHGTKPRWKTVGAWRITTVASKSNFFRRRSIGWLQASPDFCEMLRTFQSTNGHILCLSSKLTLWRPSIELFKGFVVRRYKRYLATALEPPVMAHAQPAKGIDMAKDCGESGHLQRKVNHTSEANVYAEESANTMSKLSPGSWGLQFGLNLFVLESFNSRQSGLEKESHIPCRVWNVW